MDQQPPEAPAYQPPTTQSTPSIVTVNKKRKILAFCLLIGPTALIVGTIFLYAVVNFIAAGVLSDGGMITSIVNVILFLVGAVSVLTWLPGIIAGIILLATMKKS